MEIKRKQNFLLKTGKSASIASQMKKENVDCRQGDFHTRYPRICRQMFCEDFSWCRRRPQAVDRCSTRHLGPTRTATSGAVGLRPFGGPRTVELSGVGSAVGTFEWEVWAPIWG